MNCIVIDDEPLARQGMEMLIAQVPGLELKGTFSSAVEASGFLRDNLVDLIFLDIQMPVLNGLEFLKSEKLSSHVIITTAYPQFAVDGFDLEVTDYLVKPVRFERFYKAVSRVFSDLKDEGPPDTEDDYIFIRTERKFVRTWYSEIDYVEGLKDYVIIHCGGDKHMVASNLKTIHESLPASLFLRINKSFVINMSKVKAIENDWILIGTARLPIGENFRKPVLDFVNMKKVIRRPNGKRE
jgi:DNA-binding LytR/AlgR family response regulator